MKREQHETKLEPKQQKLQKPQEWEMLMTPQRLWGSKELAALNEAEG